MAESIVSFYSIASLFSGNEKLIKRGEAAVKAKHVLECRYDSEIGRIYGRVEASMKNVVYNPEVFLTDNGSVSRTTCSCPRAEDVCHHRAALLLHAKNNLSRTDVPCRWVKRKESTQFHSVEDLFPGAYTSCLDRSVNDSDREWFRQQLTAVSRFTGFAWILSPESEKPTLPVPIVSDLMLEPAYGSAASKVQFMLDRLKLTQEQVNETEIATRGQRDNNLWGIVRKGRLTASNFGSVLKVHNSGRQPCKSLFKTLLGEYDIGGLKAIQWGCTHERSALLAYEEHSGNTVHSSGIWLTLSGCLGASPDGLVGHDKIVEVKCPYRLQNKEIIEQLSDSKFFVCFDDDGNCCLNLNTADGVKYYHQVQGNMALTGRKECDFCVWSPQDVLLFKVTRNDEWLSNIDILELFYREHYLPAFLASGA